MTDHNNTHYAFPLPACTAHTSQWEDGKRDECYRCGAKRPRADSAPEVERIAELRRRGHRARQRSQPAQRKALRAPSPLPGPGRPVSRLKTTLGVAVFFLLAASPSLITGPF